VVENVEFTADSINHSHQPGRRACSVLEESVRGTEFQATGNFEVRTDKNAIKGKEVVNGRKRRRDVANET
jgi:hypothetical protein